MKKSDIKLQYCSIARAVGVVGDPWTLLILRELFVGVRRFDELQAYTGASPQLVKERLRNLEGEGVLYRERYGSRRMEYLLTAKGLALWPVVIELAAWHNQWSEWRYTPPVKLKHYKCGEEIEIGQYCPYCGERMSSESSEFVLSNTAISERAQRLRQFREAKSRRTNKE